MNRKSTPKLTEYYRWIRVEAKQLPEHIARVTTIGIRSTTVTPTPTPTAAAAGSPSTDLVCLTLLSRLAVLEKHIQAFLESGLGLSTIHTKVVYGSWL